MITNRHWFPILLFVFYCCGDNETRTYYTIEDANQSPDKVKVLYMSGLKLGNFPDDIRKYKNLEELSLPLCGINEIPSWIGKLKKLKYIDLLNNRISKIPIELYTLENLEYLSLYGNEIDSIDDRIRDLKKLKELDLSLTNLRELPYSFRELDHLEVLYFYYNGITTIPKEISSLKNLWKLDVHANPINKIPIEITQMQSLTELRIGNNILTDEHVDSVRQLMPLCRIIFERDSIPDFEKIIEERKKKRMSQSPINFTQVAPFSS